MLICRQTTGFPPAWWAGAVAASTALLAAPALQAQSLPAEVQVGTNNIIDAEFDWARDGVYCPTCNFGAGNSRFAFIDNDNKLWVGQVGFYTGGFYPPDGRGTLVDSNAVAPKDIGNGPEWAFSQRGSELLYDRWTDGMPQTFNNLKLGFARMSGGSWMAGAVEGSDGMVLPVGSMDPGDATPAAHYQTLTARVSQLFWREVTPSAAATALPLKSRDNAMTRRWVPGTRDIIITAPGNVDMMAQAVEAKRHVAQGENAQAGDLTVYKQVFLYHTGTGVLEQLTFDPVDKLWAFMWAAPEYNNENVFFVVTGGNNLSIYRQMKRPDRTLRWRVVKTITMPTDTPYISSPEPFVHNGKSYIFFTLSANPDLHDYTATTRLVMTGLEPGTMKMLTSDTDPPRVRKDPESFITANGPYIYYNRYLVPKSPEDPRINEGVFRVDTGLGPLVP